MHRTPADVINNVVRGKKVETLRMEIRLLVSREKVYTTRCRSPSSHHDIGHHTSWQSALHSALKPPHVLGVFLHAAISAVAKQRENVQRGTYDKCSWPDGGHSYMVFRLVSHQDATFVVKLCIGLFICISLHPPLRCRVLYLTLLIIR